MAGLFVGLFICLVAMSFILLIIKWEDRPQPNSREALEAKDREIKYLQRRVNNQTNLLTDLDAQARAEYTVSQSNFAWSVSDKIIKNRERIHELEN